MFVVCVIALLCSVSVSHAAPLTCEDLVRPLDAVDPRRLEGRWALVAGSLNDPARAEKFKTRDSASIHFANASDTSEISFTRIFSFGDSCQYLHSNISLEGNSFSFNEYNINMTFLYTSCPDCVVMRFDGESNNLLHLYLFSRRREVEQKETEEFKTQVECLNMPPPVAMDPTKELCPEQISRGEEPAEGQKA